MMYYLLQYGVLLATDNLVKSSSNKLESCTPLLLLLLAAKLVRSGSVSLSDWKGESKYTSLEGEKESFSTPSYILTYFWGRGSVHHGGNECVTSTNQLCLYVYLFGSSVASTCHMLASH